MDSQKSSWPTASILIWGTFGAKTPEGRRYHHRCIGALALMMVGLFASVLFANVHDRVWWIIPALLPGAAFAFIFWEFRRYIDSLDELARRLQLKPSWPPTSRA
jgi:uncharacterized BrkB/YihY/UPF0761 family membrane protein